MGALRINLTDGTSTFIDLVSATSVEVLQSTTEKFIISVGSTAYQVIRFGTKNPEDGSGINEIVWKYQMDAAYAAIAADPIRYGYPRLGNDKNTYIQYDDEKFLSSAIDSALSNIAEPAVLSNRTARAINITTVDEAEEFNTKLADVLKACAGEADTNKADCEKAVADAACVEPGYTWPELDPVVTCPCGDAACCAANEQLFISNCVDATLDAQPIKWNHQYLFDSVTTSES